METRGFWRLEHVSDAGLRHGLDELITSACRIDARIVAHLAEVNRRKLYLKDGFSSLYKYCLLKLRLSEGESFSRMVAAEMAGRFPMVFGLLEQRKIHLSGLVILRRFLTLENHRELLLAACGKTKAQIEELLASRFPGQRAEDKIRKLRTRITAITARPSPSDEATRAGSRGSAAAANEVAVLDQTAGEVTTQPEGPRVEGPVEPTEARYRIQFDASSRLKAKLDLARALSSHANPGGELEVLVERALDAYLEQLQKRRFGKTDRPRASKSDADQANPSNREHDAAAPEQRIPTGKRTGPRGHLARSDRRTVAERCDGRCSFVGTNGQRCGEQAFVQFDHQRSWRRWGGDGHENLRLLCAAHNRWFAEREVGAEHVARCIEQERRKRSEQIERGSGGRASGGAACNST